MTALGLLRHRISRRLRDNRATGILTLPFGEVRAGKWPEELSGLLVIRFGRVNFAGERAEIYLVPVALDTDFPLSLDLVPFEAFVFRAGFSLCLGAVADILRYGRGAEICLAIIETVAIYVVADHSRRHVDDFVVHPDSPSLPGVFRTVPADSIRAGGALGQMPFVFCQPGVIFGVDDGKFAACQWYSSEGVAVAHPAV